MEVLYPRCAGLDVHKATVVAAVRLAAGGKVAREVRTFATTTAGLLELAAWLAESGCTHVAMEATGVYWQPVWHILAEGGFVLVLANAAQVRNVPGRKTDVGDAAWLAELLAHGLVRASFVPDGPTAELRSLLRTRKQLAREKASHVLRLQKTLEDANVKLDGVVADLLGKSGRAMLEALVAANVRGGGGDSGCEAARRSDPHESGAGAPPPRRSGGHRASRLGWSCDASSWWRTDDRGQTATGRAAAEGRRRGFPADRRRGGAAAADGERRGGPDRGRALRAQRGAAQLPQRVSRARPRHPARHAAAAHPQAPAGRLLPPVPRAAEGEREGAGRRHPGGLDRGRLDPAGGRPRPGHGPRGHLEEHGLEALQGHRRARDRLPGAAARGRVALPVAGRDLPEG